MREAIANYFARFGVGMAEMIGTERVVEVSEHSIDLSFEKPGTNDRAWDPNLYQKGQVYIRGYANPVKPAVEHNADLDDPDVAYIKVAEKEETDAEPYLITSDRYQSYMHQDLIDSLLTPREKWRLFAFAILAVGFFVVVNIMISLSNAGVF